MTLPQSVKAPASAVLLTLMPSLFVLLWSTGFLGMRLGAPHAEPFTFMMWRMGLVVTILLAAAAVLRAPWPGTPREAGHIAVAGLLTHATYLSGVLVAIQKGLPLGYVALIAGLQPVLTALLATGFLGERLGAMQWSGLAIGFAGVVLVVAGKTGSAPVDWPAVGSAALALAGITLGTLYQKRHCAHMDLITGGIVQFAATGAVLTVLAFAFETRVVHWTGEFIFALFWLAIVLSLGAISLLYLMIRRGAASKVASLFFLTPSVTAVLAWLLFNETLPGLAIAGMAITAVGVALVTRSPS
ncbi:MAG: DMT family transporter [Betaproteobacteria bacterium]|nr:DMT family transporter [Betaproteobacteria bacterium]